jgi:hypothetical protein
MSKDSADLMEDQIPASTPPEKLSAPRITPDQLEQLKAIARERAIQATFEQQAQTQLASIQPQVPPSYLPPNQQVVYVRRNLTVAELILVFALACGVVTGLQAGFNVAANWLPRLEIKVK